MELAHGKYSIFCHYCTWSCLDKYALIAVQVEPTEVIFKTMQSPKPEGRLGERMDIYSTPVICQTLC